MPNKPTKQYLVSLITGRDIKIEEEELPLVLEAMSSPQRIAIKLKQGILINQWIVGIFNSEGRLPLEDVFAGNDFIKKLTEKKLLK